MGRLLAAGSSVPLSVPGVQLASLAGNYASLSCGLTMDSFLRLFFLDICHFGFKVGFVLVDNCGISIPVM